MSTQYSSLLMNWEGFGVVLRNHFESFVTTRNGRFHCNRNPSLAEAIACQEALSWIKEIGANNVILEFGNLNFCYIQILQCCLIILTHAQLLVSVCPLSILLGMCQYVCHIGSLVNQAPHVLARASGSQARQRAWIVISHYCIYALVASN